MSNNIAFWLKNALQWYPWVMAQDWSIFSIMAYTVHWILLWTVKIRLYLSVSVTFCVCVILYIQKGDAYSIHCTLDTAVNCQNTSLLVCICDILCYTVHTEGRCIHYTLYLAFFLNLFILYIQYMTVAISYIQYI